MTKSIITRFPLFLIIILSSCSSNRNFETADQFKKWVENKTFTSVGKDLDQWDSKGAYNSPVGSLELKFNGTQMTYQNCSPQIYNVYKDDSDWIVGFHQCLNGDLFELVVPTSGDMYVRSLDYDISKMKEGTGNAVGKLDAIASKKVTRGPTMEITDEHNVTVTEVHQDSTYAVVDTNQHNSRQIVDTAQKSQLRKTQPIGKDTTSLIVQSHTEKGDVYKISDKLPLSYQIGNNVFTFSKGDSENTLKLEGYNESGLFEMRFCEQQGIYIYVTGTQDIFTCVDGKVLLGSRNANKEFQLYQVKME